MTLAFLFVLVAYVAILAAAFPTNSVLGIGAVNTATVGLCLYAILMAYLHRGNNQRFWFGFCLFFVGYVAVHAIASSKDLLQYTLGDFLGLLIASMTDQQSADPFYSPIFKAHVWYAHLADCLIAILAGLAGGVTTMLARPRR